MDDIEECPHGAGDPSWCSICLKRPEPEHTWMSNAFRCTYKGQCESCRKVIVPGDWMMIRKKKNSRGEDQTIGMIHADCNEE